MRDQADRTRRHTAADVLRRIDGTTVASLSSCAESPAAIDARLRRLEPECAGNERVRAVLAAVDARSLRMSMQPRLKRAAPVLVLAAIGIGAVAQQTQLPPGADKTAKTRVLELGAKALQGNAPLGPMDVYLVGFHPMKEHPQHQMEAHHFCHQVNQDFAQCVLFDGHGKDAHLNGIEYIVSEKLFETLPPEERQYWHPHNAEILSGQLVAPGIPAVAEKALMKDKMNSYGKTWHVWNTGMPGAAGDKLPLGPAMLAWSFNRDGEARPGLVEQRDRNMGVDSAEKRRQRAELRALAKPQSGVDSLKAAFPQARPIPGVLDKQASAAPAASAAGR